MEQVRQQRVANGSNRKRDLAVRFSCKAFARKHFPNQPYGEAATFACWVRCHKRSEPSPAEVQDYLQGKGWLA